MTELNTKAQELEQEMEIALHTNNERIVKGMVINFKELFKEVPHLQARWRVWAHSIIDLHYDSPLLDIKLDNRDKWFLTGYWRGPFWKEIDFTHRRDGRWVTDEKCEDIDATKLPGKSWLYLNEISTYAQLFNFNMYRNLGFFEDGRAKHWTKVAAHNITKNTINLKDEEDSLLSVIISKNNYFSAITEAYSNPEFTERLRIELEQEELNTKIAVPEKSIGKKLGKI